MKNLLEGKRLDAEFNRYTDTLSKELFDKVVSLDPQSDIEQDRLGYSAKSFLLPHAKDEEDFISNNADRIKNALVTFTQNRSSYPTVLKRIDAFPSIKDFVEYIELGDESDFAKNNDLTSAEEEVKKSPLDDIFDKYYSKDFSRENFDKIISSDPETIKDKKIGSIAKNLFLPKFKKGENFFDEFTQDDLITACNNFNTDKQSYPKEKQSLEGYESVKEFVQYTLSGPESDFLKKLKSCEWVDDTTGRKVKDDIEVIGSTKDYEIIRPLSHTANNAITCNCELKSRGSEYLVWCTGWTGDDYQWRSHSDREYIYCFIYKKDPKDPLKNYQGAILKRDYTIYQFLDGNDKAFREFNAGSSTSQRFFQAFLEGNPDIVNVLSKAEYIKENPQVKKLKAIQDFKDKPYDLNNETKKDFESLDSDIKKIISEININLEEIDDFMFNNLSGLKKVTFKEGLKTIGVEAFQGCIWLNDIVLPQTLKEIKAEAFAQCMALSNTIRIPDSLTKIGRAAFEGTKCKLSINKDRKTPLMVDSNDKAWFMRHAKLITIQEELEGDTVYKISLDENLPRDLANAYKKAYYTDPNKPLNSILSVSNTYYNMLTNRRRREINDANSSYEALTPEQACEYLTLRDPRIDGTDENGKYILSTARVLNRELCNSRINNLRFLSDGRLIQFFIGDGNTLHSLYSTTIPTDKFGSYPFFNKGHEAYTSRLHTYTDLWILIHVVDKIYKTDEFENIIDTSTPTGKKIKIAKTDDAGNVNYEVVDDTIQARRARNNKIKPVSYMLDKTSSLFIPHNPYKNIRYKNFIDVLDTGAHNIQDAGGMADLRYMDGAHYDYTQKEIYKSQAKKEFKLAQKALNELKRNKDIFSEREYAMQLNDAIQHKKELENEYLTKILDAKKAKDKALISCNDVIYNLHKAFTEQIKQLSDIEAEMFNLKNDITALKISSVQPEVEKIKDSLTDAQEDLEAYERVKRNLLQKLDELKQEINENDANIEKVSKEITEIKDNMSNAADNAIIKKFNKLKEMEDNLADLQNNLDAMFPKQAAIRKEKQAKNKIKSETDFDTVFNGLLQTQSDETPSSESEQ